MTSQDYKEYEAAVAAFFLREGIANLSPGCIVCPICGEDLHSSGVCDEACPGCGEDMEVINEPDFSWTACDCCGSSPGGDRSTASGYHPASGECFEYSVCQDCVYYSTYGQLDDMTMMDMEEVS